MISQLRALLPLARSALLAICLLLPSACETGEGRVRQGIHDPIDRHPPKFWKRVFGSSEKKPKPKREEPEPETVPFEDQPVELPEPG